MPVKKPAPEAAADTPPITAAMADAPIELATPPVPTAEHRINAMLAKAPEGEHIGILCRVFGWPIPQSTTELDSYRARLDALEVGLPIFRRLLGA